MARRTLSVMVLAFAAVLLVFNLALAQDAGPQAVDVSQAALGTAFTYQGQLKTGGAGVTGSCDMAFRLFDDAAIGNQVGTPVTQTVAMNDGLFTVQLDFGASAFNGQARWLKIDVRCPSGSGDFTTLAPRQPLTPAPYANYASGAGSAPWNGLTGIPAGFADGVDNVSVAVSGTNIFAGSGLSQSTSGNVITLAVNFAGSGEATTVARSDHAHWGVSWSGSGTGLTLAGGSTGINASGTAWGVYGQSAFPNGIGVYGYNSSATGQNYGLYGRTVSPDGVGVYGYSTLLPARPLAYTARYLLPPAGRLFQYDRWQRPLYQYPYRQSGTERRWRRSPGGR